MILDHVQHKSAGKIAVFPAEKNNYEDGNAPAGSI